ncbi:MAG: hypothetical protein ACLS6O_04995 [Bifidobacterium sp.]
MSNVEASIEGDGITATQATQYIGNVASGASGSIDSLSPLMRPANMMPN